MVQTPTRLRFLPTKCLRDGSYSLVRRPCRTVQGPPFPRHDRMSRRSLRTLIGMWVKPEYTAIANGVSLPSFVLVLLYVAYG